MGTLTRREPFDIELPAWVTRLFEDRPFDIAFERATSIRLEEFVEDGTLVVRAEMPGVDPDKDIEISLHDGMLHIKAERSEKEEHRGKAFYRSEFRYGAFERTVPLPSGATVEAVKATYTDGVLEIRVPTAAATSGATKVPVQKVS